MDFQIAPKNVVNLYDIAGITTIAGISDYTEGIYNGNPSTDYNIAKKNQHNYLLDEIDAKERFKLLDVGCGLGTLLETARERGVIGTGITISEDQFKRCKNKGLDVHLLNYKNLPLHFNGRFDGIIANGSLEHFCQPEEALQGNQNYVYKHMFKIFYNLLNPNSPSQKLATTAIHFNGNHINPKKLLRNPFLNFDEKHFYFSILHKSMGGYYPIKDQLKKCASDSFYLIKEVNGTNDYYLTSEYWTSQFKKALFTIDFRKELWHHFKKRPIHSIWTFLNFIGIEAWPWQFRSENPPTRLYRHTWKRNSNN